MFKDILALWQAKYIADPIYIVYLVHFSHRFSFDSPDITVIVDWELKTNHLSYNYLIVWHLPLLLATPPPPPPPRICFNFRSPTTKMTLLPKADLVSPIVVMIPHPPVTSTYSSAACHDTAVDCFVKVCRLLKNKYIFSKTEQASTRPL